MQIGGGVGRACAEKTEVQFRGLHAELEERAHILDVAVNGVGGAALLDARVGARAAGEQLVEERLRLLVLDVGERLEAVFGQLLPGVLDACTGNTFQPFGTGKQQHGPDDPAFELRRGHFPDCEGERIAPVLDGDDGFLSHAHTPATSMFSKWKTHVVGSRTFFIEGNGTPLFMTPRDHV